MLQNVCHNKQVIPVIPVPVLFGLPTYNSTNIYSCTLMSLNDGHFDTYTTVDYVMAKVVCLELWLTNKHHLTRRSAVCIAM